MTTEAGFNSLPVKVGLLGLGTVGVGTINVLTRNQDEIRRRAGREIQCSVACVQDVSKPRQCDLSEVRLTTDANEILNDPEIQVVVELIGGEAEAREWVLQAIRNKKHVVTANKALIAKHGQEIFSEANRVGVMVAFEAAVAGGIPIIKTLREGLAGNRVKRVTGIINGTCNFILTEMREKGRDFSDVLQEAQRLGYAEADPTFDIEGVDAAHKLTILAAIAFGMPLDFDSVYTEGVGGVTAEDVANAESLGYRIKHLGIARQTDKGVELRVHPTLLPKQRLLANVEGVMNAIEIRTDAVGESLFYGPGAGADPTASAVVADIVDVVRQLTADPENRVPHLAFQPDTLNYPAIVPMEELETAYYVYCLVSDQPGVLADITAIFAAHKISISAIEQHHSEAGENQVPLMLLTKRTKESNLQSALQEMAELASVTGEVKRIRVGLDH